MRDTSTFSFHRRLTLFFLLATNTIAFCQVKLYSISGQLKKSDTSKTLIPLSLYTANDSLIKRSFSNDQGVFRFDFLSSGKYYVSINALNYQPHKTSIIKITNTDQYIDSIVLQSTFNSLSEVTVTGRKAFIENKPGRITLNIDASPTNAGASIWEVLEKAPGVTVSDQDNTVGLKGKQGVIILLDGKQTYMTGPELTTLLKSLQASNIDQIEILDQPPVKYEAAGNAGLINIKTKINKNYGLNGNLSLGITAGTFRYNGAEYLPLKTSNLFSINYRTTKSNFFLNYTNNIRAGKGEFRFWRKFYDNAGIFRFQNRQQTIQENNATSNVLRAGADFTLNTRTILGVNLNTVLSGTEFTPRGNTQVSDSSDNLLSSLASKNINITTLNTFGANINLKRSLKKKGSEYSVDIDYLQYSNTADQELNVSSFDNNGNPNGNLTLLSGLQNKIKVFAGKTDFLFPVTNGNLDFGIKTSLVNTDNIITYNRSSNGYALQLNHFVLSENINSAYLNLNLTTKKLKIQFGLRVENTNMKGEQKEIDSSFKRQYTNLFPSISLNYPVGKKTDLFININRRIDRPIYSDLNPFRIFLDSMSSRVGNPFLLPQLSYNIQAGILLNKKYTVSLNYSSTQNIMAQVRQQDVVRKITFVTVRNFREYQNLGMSLVVPVRPLKSWNLNFSSNVFHNRFSGLYSGANSKTDFLKLSSMGWTLNVINIISLPKNYTIELSGNYRSDQLNIMRREKSQHAVNAGISKSIINGQGSLKFSIRNIFDSQQYRSLDEYSNVYIDVFNYQDTRSASLVFTYRFGKNTLNPPRAKKNAIEEEQNRIGTN